MGSQRGLIPISKKHLNAAACLLLVVLTACGQQQTVFILTFLPEQLLGKDADDESISNTGAIVEGADLSSYRQFGVWLRPSAVLQQGAGDGYIDLV